MDEDLFSAAQRTPNAGGGEAPGEPPIVHTMRGEVLRVIFSSADGQYIVVRLRDNHGREHTVVGPMTGILEGQEIEAAGTWDNHKEHGRRFKVREFKAVLPSSEQGIRRYLASGLIHGIGKTYAERIVEHFGLETLTVLDRYSERLKEVPGIGPKRIAEIRKAWHDHTAQRDIVIFLQGLGLSAAWCARIISRYGAGAAEVVRRNPYRLASDVHGIGFLTADRIASRLGVEKTNPLRLAAGTLHVLDVLAKKGHVCYPEDLLLHEAEGILGVGRAEAEDGLTRVAADGRAVRVSPGPTEPPCVYHRLLFAAETGVAEAIHVLLNNRTLPRRIRPTDFGPNYGRLNELQKQAVHHAFAHPISIITGGPGVGKTTVIGEIVGTARHLRMKVLLAAPTGRAAKRMSESTGAEAMTIHRLLKWDPATRAFVYGADKPLGCDMLIVDEVSMLDVSLANSLLRAVKPGTALVLVGDRDQLPSVGPGTVLRDLIASGKIAVTHLTQIYRQDEHSRIVTNAHAVNSGTMPSIRPLPRDVRGDFYWIEKDDPEQVAELIALLVAERIPKSFGFDPMEDIQVLAPMHRGNCGAIALNERLQSVLNPGGGKAEFKTGERTFRVGDRVMQTVNNYDKGVFNGELGRIRAIDYKTKTFRVQFDTAPVDYDWTDADQILHAYAVTVHKSQGSEFPVVVLPLLTQHYVMLQRNLLYTGMTRARKLLVMVGSRKALALAVRNDRPARRFTLLKPRLRGRPGMDDPEEGLDL